MNCQLIVTDVTDIGDPFVLNYKGVYYMYATSSKEGFKVWKSHDLKNWRDCGLCYFKEDSFGYMDFWAPEVTVRRDGKLVMHFTAKDKTSNGLRIGVAVADSPLGVFRDVYRGKPMFDLGYSVIDAHCFTDDDGKSYLYYVRDVSDNVQNGIHKSEIYVSPLSDSLTELTAEGKMVLTPSGEEETTLNPTWQWNEGPFVLKHGDRYYLNYSYNVFDSKYYSVGVAESDSPTGGFVKTNRYLLRYTPTLSGPGHNSYFTDNDGQLWCAFHVHTRYDSPSGDRTACLAPAYFDSDGRLFVRYK